MGRNPTPAGLFRRQDELNASQDDEHSALQRWHDRMQQLERVRDKASLSSQLAQERQARYYDAKHRDVQYSVGDRVWRKNRVQSSAMQGIAAKLAPKYAGPYVVAARLGTNVYQLRDMLGDDAGKISVVDLKPYHDAPGPREEEPDECASANAQHSQEHENETAVPVEVPRPSTSSETAQDAPPPRKRGRPRKTCLYVRGKRVVFRKAKAPPLAPSTVESDSSDESSTHEDSTEQNAGVPVADKRGRGRPKGSRNKDIEPAVTTSPRRTRARK